MVDRCHARRGDDRRRRLEGRLGLSVALDAGKPSASIASGPLAVTNESLDADKRRTGALRTTIYPAAADYYRRFAIDLSTMTADGAFDPGAPNVAFTFDRARAVSRRDRQVDAARRLVRRRHMGLRHRPASRPRCRQHDPAMHRRHGLHVDSADWVAIEHNTIRDNLATTVGYAPAALTVMKYANFDAADNVPKFLIAGNRIFGNKVMVSDMPYGKEPRDRRCRLAFCAQS